MIKLEQPEQTIDLARYMESHGIRKRTAPASATFEVTIESPPPSDPSTGLAKLEKSTKSLAIRNGKQVAINRHLDDVIARNIAHNRRKEPKP